MTVTWTLAEALPDRAVICAVPYIACSDQSLAAHRGHARQAAGPDHGCAAEHRVVLIVDCCC